MLLLQSCVMSNGANSCMHKLTSKAVALKEDKEQKKKKKEQKKKISNKKWAAETSSSASSDKESHHQAKHCRHPPTPKLVEIGCSSSDDEPEIVNIGHETTEEEADSRDSTSGIENLDDNENEESEVQPNVSNVTTLDEGNTSSLVKLGWWVEGPASRWNDWKEADAGGRLAKGATEVCQIVLIRSDGRARWQCARRRCRESGCAGCGAQWVGEILTEGCYGEVFKELRLNRRYNWSCYCTEP